jgi:hypothetical protein
MYVRKSRRSASGGVEITQLEQRLLCSQTLPVALPWLSATHTGIVHQSQRPHGVSSRPPTVSNKTPNVSSKPSASSLLAPSGLTAKLATSTSAQLNWTDNGSATGYCVLRSVDGSGFSRIVSIGSSTASSYTDNTLIAGHTYSYEVQAYSGKQTSGVSNIANVTAKLNPPSAPTNLTASPAGSWVSLGWTDVDPTATGYLVLRSTDGTNFAQIANLNSATASNTADMAVTAGQVYYYEVAAYNSAGSTNSNVASVTAPAAQSGSGVTIGYRFSNELVVNAAGASDSISVSQTGSTLNITADGVLSSYPVPAAGLFIYTRGGSDGISIDNTVSATTTVMTIDGATTAINSTGTNVNVWMDSTDSFNGSANLHRVASFAGGVSKTAGASLADPYDSGATFQATNSLFGTGPIAFDVNQGDIGDCYFLSSLAAFANSKPSVLTGSAVDMGDGTYTVQFVSGSTPTFVRVSNDIPSGKFGGYAYAHPGTVTDPVWAAIIEKAFCYFRTGANTYASINSGWMSEVYSDFGISNSSFVPGAYSESAFYNIVSTDLANGRAVTFGTSASAPNLVQNHGYTLISASIDSSGVTHYLVRNPWGFAGDSLEDGLGYATLTFSQVVANFFQGVQALG